MLFKNVNPKSRLWTCFALLAIVVACGGDPEEEAWKGAKIKRSAEGYWQFLEKYPEGVFSQEAREALEEVHFKQVQKDNTLEAVEGFLEQHPDGLHAEEVRRTEDILHWVNAQRFPDGPSAESARKTLEGLRSVH